MSNLQGYRVVDSTTTSIGRCSDCGIPSSGHRRVYVVEENAYCEACIKHHGYKTKGREVFKEKTDEEKKKSRKNQKLASSQKDLIEASE